MNKFTVLNKQAHTLQSQRSVILDKAEKHLADLLPDQLLKQSLTAIAMLALPSLPQLYETFTHRRLFALRNAKTHKQALQILLATETQSSSAFNPFVPTQTVHIKQVSVDTSKWWGEACECIRMTNSPPNGNAKELAQERDDIIRYLERESASRVWGELSKGVFEKAFRHSITIAWSSLSSVLLTQIKEGHGRNESQSTSLHIDLICLLAKPEKVTKDLEIAIQAALDEVEPLTRKIRR